MHAKQLRGYLFLVGGLVIGFGIGSATTAPSAPPPPSAKGIAILVDKNLSMDFEVFDEQWNPAQSATETPLVEGKPLTIVIFKGRPGQQTATYPLGVTPVANTTYCYVPTSTSMKKVPC
jgi:hypothetical protein